MEEKGKDTREKLMEKLESASEEMLRMIYAFVLGRMG